MAGEAGLVCVGVARSRLLADAGLQQFIVNVFKIFIEPNIQILKEG